jgi:nucleoside-diphosphate-sugar epimerase
MNSIIIGCGYVGTAVAQHWTQQGLTVTATTTNPDRLPELRSIAAHALVLTGNDEIALKAALENQQIVLLSVGAPNPDAYDGTYRQTAKTLVSVLPQTPVQQVIYTGSYAVYGDHKGEWVTEETPVRPANVKGEILSETEQILLGAASAERQVCVLRLGGIYGPGRELVKLLGRAAGTTRPGDGSDRSNWIHRDDIVGAIDFARVHRLNGVYNLVQDTPFTTQELFARVCAAHQLEPVIWDASRSSDRPYNAKVSNQKLKDAGYRLIHPEMEIG